MSKAQHTQGPVQIAVNKLSAGELLQVITDYEQFERDGFIGDCILRRTAHDV